MRTCYVVSGGLHAGRRMRARCDALDVTAFFCGAFRSSGSALLGSPFERTALRREGRFQLSGLKSSQSSNAAATPSQMPRFRGWTWIASDENSRVSVLTCKGGIGSESQGRRYFVDGGAADVRGLALVVERVRIVLSSQASSFPGVSG